MKRKIALIAIGLMLFSTGTAFGGAVNGYYHDNPIVRLFSDGKELTGDVPAQIIDGRTLVPIGTLRDAGFQVLWDQDTYQVDVSKPEPLTDAQLAEIKKSVGIVYVHNKKGTWSQGSGFQLAGGAFVTAHHVLDEDGTIGDIRIDLNGKTYNLTEKDISYKNAERDIAALKFSNDAPGLKVQKSTWKAGQLVYTVGYPEQKWESSSGYVTGYNGSQLYSNAFADGGDSGGPLLNFNGEVLAINVGVLAGGTTVSPLLSLYINNLK